LSDYRISDKLNQLLLALSRGPVAEHPWQEFMRLLGEALAADFATLILRAPREGDAGVVLNSVVLSPQVFDSYNESYFAIDPFVNLPVGEVYTLEEFVVPDDYYASDYYQQYVKPTGIVHLMGADLSDEMGNSARLRIARVEGRQNFGARERELCTLLLPHIQQTIRLHARIARVESERSLFAGAMDQMAVAAFVLDQNARIRHSNGAGKLMLTEGRWLREKEGQLRLLTSANNSAFRQCLEEVMAAHLRGEPAFIRALRLSEGDGAGVGMLLRPLPQDPVPGGSRNPSVAIFVSDPSRPAVAPADLLMTLFGFTPAEAKLSLQLANGANLDEACKHLHISRNTGKSQLSSVFAKTGVTRQSGLIQLLLRSVAQLGE
jgi:DNA-binding CsgD family transcriptional regulator